MTDFGPPESHENPIPRWLKLIYLSLPIWGILTLYILAGGSMGILSPKTWPKLQKAANTTLEGNQTETDKS